MLGTASLYKCTNGLSIRCHDDAGQFYQIKDMQLNNDILTHLMFIVFNFFLINILMLTSDFYFV